MARPTEADDIDYRKYLDSSDPTPLMKHIEEWIRDKAAIDPSKFRTKAEAFAAGIHLTVHLRMAHQASPENQARLETNRQAKEAAETEKADRRAARAAAGEAPRGRKPKAKPVVEEAPAPKKRARRAAPKAAAQETPAKKTRNTPTRGGSKPAAETEAPKRRPGRPRKAAAAATASAPDNVTPIRRRRSKAATAVVTETSPAAGAASTPAKPPVRRRAARRGEAAF